MAETLLGKGYSVLVYDNHSQKASMVAGGLYNPVVLKRLNLSHSRRNWRDATSRAEREQWSYRDFLAVKYDSTNGSEMWAATHDGPGGDRDEALDIAVDADGLIGRAMSASYVPKSGEQLDQMAPILTVARKATTVSGMSGIKDATRSPFLKRVPVVTCCWLSTMIFSEATSSVATGSGPLRLPMKRSRWPSLLKSAAATPSQCPASATAVIIFFMLYGLLGLSGTMVFKPASIRSGSSPVSTTGGFSALFDGR